MDAEVLLTKVKTRLQITTAKHDAFLKEVAPDWLEWAKVETNNQFLVDGSEKIPGPVIQFVAKASEYSMHEAGVKNSSAGTTSDSFEQNLPEGILKLLRPYRKVRFRAAK